MYRITVGNQRNAVDLELEFLGFDILLKITGGEAHIGAVAVSIPVGGVESPPEIRHLIVGKHREGPIIEEAARRICIASRRVVTVLAGIHIDNATRTELAEIVENIRKGLSDIEIWLGDNIPDSEDT